MREVSNRALTLIFEGLRRKNLDPQALLEGLPLRYEDLLSPKGRLDWELYAEIATRYENRIGGPAEAQKAAVVFVESPGYEIFRRSLGLFASARSLYWAVHKSVGHRLFTIVNSEFQDLPGGRVRITLSIPPAIRDCPAFFRLCGYTFGYLPRILGQHQVPKVEMEILPRRCVYTITPPPSHTIRARLGRAFRILFAAQGIFEELREQHEELAETYDELAESRKDFQALVDRLPMGVVVHTNGVVVYANQVGRTLFGGSSDAQLEGRPLLEFIHSDDRRYATPEFLGGRGKMLIGSRTQVRLAPLAGRVRQVELHPIQSVRFQGKVASFLACTDITIQVESQTVIEEQRLTLERSTQLFAMSRMASIGEMAAGVAHEINNPLTAVLGAAGSGKRLLSRERGISAESKTLVRLFDSIEVGADRIVKIIDSMRKLGRAQRVEKLSLVPLSEILESVVLLCHERFKVMDIDLRVSAAPSEISLECDPGEISQIVINLLNNAIDAIVDARSSAKEGTVRTGYWVALEAVLRDTTWIEISVTDTGNGVPESIRDRIMTPFFTTKEVGKGTGLGLSVSRQIAETHRGSLELDPSSRHTRFTL